jgi:hypothetical protein
VAGGAGRWGGERMGGGEKWWMVVEGLAGHGGRWWGWVGVGGGGWGWVGVAGDGRGLVGDGGRQWGMCCILVGADTQAVLRCTWHNGLTRKTREMGGDSPPIG